jgi:hypothetical protein
MRLEMNPDVYDAMELSCMIWGGIGAGPIWVFTGSELAAIFPKYENNMIGPHCLIGHVTELYSNVLCSYYDNEIVQEFRRLKLTDDFQDTGGFGSTYSDESVKKAAISLGRGDTEKVSWEEFCNYWNIVRGDNTETAT